MKTIKFKENHEVKKGIIFLVFALLCNMGVSAQTEFVIGNLKYTTTSSSTVSVSKNEIITGKLVIPETVKYKGTQYSVTSIGQSAFRYCTGLTSVTIPNSVTSIGESAFEMCTSLTSLIIPNSVTSIGDFAFFYCYGLTSVTIGNSVTSIGEKAIYRCTGLTVINVDENNTSFSSIDGVLFNKSQTELIRYPEGKQGAYTIPNSVTSIGESAFGNCTELTSVTIGNSVTSIGKWAFNDCTGLTSVIIPNSVTSIGERVFESCTSLISIDIPNSVTSIGQQAFEDCTGLTDIYCHIEKPLTITADVFKDVPTNTCTLHVPIGSKSKYKAANVWKEFNIVEDLPTGIVSIDNSQLTIDNGVWYTLNGVRLNGKPTKAGVYIVNGKKVVIK